MIKVTNRAKRHWCRTFFSCSKQRNHKCFFPVRFTFSFSERLPLCLIWRFWGADRFIYSAGGEGPFHSFARGDKATADCQSNSMLNTFPLQTCRASTEESHCWYSASFMLVPFSCFHLVKENVYPAGLLLIRDHIAPQEQQRQTEGERLLCSMRGIHKVLNRGIVTSAYCFCKYSMFSYSRHLPPTGHSLAQISCLFSPTGTFLKTLLQISRKFSHIQYWSKNWPRISAPEIGLVPITAYRLSSTYWQLWCLCFLIWLNKGHSFTFCPHWVSGGWSDDQF